MTTANPVWFQLTADNDRVSFHDRPRLAELFHRDLFTGAVSYPSLTCLLGRSRKDGAVERIFQGQRRPSAGTWNLQVDPRTVADAHPRLVVDGDPLRPLAARGPEIHDGATSRPVEWPAAHRLDAFLARLIFPLCDLICLFVDDLGGEREARTLLQSWTTLGRTATTHRHRPRLLLISESTAVTTARRRNDPDVAATGAFASVQYLDLPVRSGPMGGDDYPLLSTVITDELEQARWARMQTRSCFSAAHLHTLYDGAVQHVCRTIEEPFDILHACRPHHPIPTSLADHLQEFLSLSPPMPRLVALSIIASSILMDAYRAQIHEFPPGDVFAALYRPHCERALSARADPLLVQEECDDLQLRLGALYEEKIRHGQPASQIHDAVLQKHRSWWDSVHSHSVCLACLMCRPQHVLPCRHAICDVCAGRWGSPVRGWEYRYRLRGCPLCRRPVERHVWTLPPTAAVRAVTIDGGGVRGMIPVENLGGLQSRLGPDCPLADCVDVSFGTSSGGLSNLEIFLLGTPVSESIRTFCRQMTSFFTGGKTVKDSGRPGLVRRLLWKWADRSTRMHARRSRRRRGGGIGRVRAVVRILASPRVSRVLRYCVTGSQYDGRALAALYRRHYGDRGMFDTHSFWSGVKVAVVAMSELPVLLTNYHVHRPKPRHGGYIPIRRSTPDQDIPIRDCAYATSAAPTFFPPIDLPGIGECWDGALSHNNPAAVCRQEIDCLWPWEPPLGVLLSFGTGSHRTVPPCDPRASPSRPGLRLVGRSLAQLFRTLMASMDGEASWTLLFQHADDALRPRLQRLNTILSGPEPAIDAVDQIPSMREMVREQGLGLHGSRALALLLAASLFFTVEDLRRPETGGYVCVGAVRCRLPGRRFLSAVRHLGWTLAGFFQDGNLMDGDLSGAVCAQCARLVVPVRFSVPDLHRPIVLSVKLHAREPFPIGGFPHPLAWFLERQGFPAGFGGCDDSVNRQVCAQCQGRIDVAREAPGPDFFVSVAGDGTSAGPGRTWI